MSRFNVSRSLKQLYAERNAMEMFIEHKKSSKSLDEMTVKEVGQLISDENLLEEINRDIQKVKENINAFDYY